MTFSTQQTVIAGPTTQKVVACAAIEQVIPVASVQRVVAHEAKQRIVAAAGICLVVAVGAGIDFISVRASGLCRPGVRIHPGSGKQDARFQRFGRELRATPCNLRCLCRF